MKTKIKKYFPPLLILVMASAVAAAGEKVAEAELHENVTNAFLNPGKASSLPRVLIIGARLGGTRPWVTAARAVTIGLLTLGLASLAGSFLD